MRKEKKIIIISIAAAVLLAVTVGVTFGWFVEGYLSDKFSFAVAFVESKVTLYKALDNNKDGVIEIDENGLPKFIELGDSERGSVVLDSSGMPLIGADGGAVYDKSKTVRFDIGGILPTEIYTWKVAIQNVGDVRAKIFADIIIPCGGAKNGGIDVLGYRVNGGETIYSANCYESALGGEYIQKVRLIDGDSVEHLTSRPEDAEKSVKEYVVAVEFLSLEALKSAGIAISGSDYAAYASKVFGSIKMSIRLEDNK